jgi:pyruvate kinase
MSSPRERVRTKIVCTLGPASRTPEAVRALLAEGMSVARINYSHGEQSEHAETMAGVRAAADEVGEPIAVMADLQGPKIRLGEIARPMDVVAGQRLTLVAEAGAADRGDGVLPLPHPEIVRALRPAGKLLFDDGAVEAVVLSIQGVRAEIEIVVGGRLSSHKGVAAPGATRRIAPLTEKDRVDAAHAVASGADFVALSFVQSADDVQALRATLDALPGGQAVGIVAKIETRAAIQEFDNILHAADAVMVARGDLGVEIPPQEVPMHQKDIIRRANRLGVPVITATQMLQSMVENPRPTRAEASDVANAILDGTDAVMLSAETAVGKHPREAVAMMREIAAIAETQMPCRLGQARFAELEHAHPVTDAISDATVRVAEEVGACFIATSTWSGYTARQVARERPRLPIVALTPNESVRRQLALTWGVRSIRIPQYAGTDDMLGLVTHAVVEAGWAKAGDLIVVSAGIPAGGGGRTNFLKVHRL